MNVYGDLTNIIFNQIKNDISKCNNVVDVGFIYRNKSQKYVKMLQTAYNTSMSILISVSFLSVFVPVILPLIKVLLGSKRQARNILDIYILVILVSKQFATFLHNYSSKNVIMNCYKLLSDYRLTCNIQIIELEWSDTSSWGQDIFRG